MARQEAMRSCRKRRRWIDGQSVGSRRDRQTQNETSRTRRRRGRGFKIKTRADDGTTEWPTAMEGCPRTIDMGCRIPQVPDTTRSGRIPPDPPHETAHAVGNQTRILAESTASPLQPSISWVSN